MNKLVVIFLLILAPFLKLKGQTVFPSWADNPSWNVLECFWYNCSTFTYQYVYDTTFCNQTYSKMSFANNVNGYFRSDNTKTTFRKTLNCNDKEYLLYDYSLNIGDTAFIGFNFELGLTNDTTAFILTQIDTVNYFGVARQRFKMNYDRCNLGFPIDYMYWTRGIGSELHPFYSYHCLCDFCENNFALLCHDSTATQLFQSNAYNTCDTTITVGLNEINKTPVISINPNPFESAAFIRNDDLESMEIKIRNTSGQFLNKLRGESEVLIGEELSPGIYFIEVNADSFRVIRKIVKL